MGNKALLISLKYDCSKKLRQVKLRFRRLNVDPVGHRRIYKS